MTNFLRKSGKGKSLASTLATAFHVPLHPRLIYRREKRTHIPLILIALIVLSPIYQSTFAVEHVHRHHHESTRLSTLHRCNDVWHPHWAEIMEEVDVEKEKSEKISKANDSQAMFQKLNELYHSLHISNSRVDDSNEDERDKDGDNVGDITSTNISQEINNNWRPHKLLLGRGQQADEFRVLDTHFGCPRGKSSRELHWHSFGAAMRKGDYNFTTSSGTTIVLSNLALFVNDGNLVLVWNKQNGEQHVYEKNDYCVWKWDDEWVTFKVCLPSCSDRSPCVRKCCPPWEVINEETRGCNRTSPEWRPTFYRTAGDTETQDRYVPNASVSFVSGFPSCQYKYKIKVNENPKNNFKLLLNGTLVHIESDSRTYIQPGDFCIDGLYYNRKTESEDRIYQGSEWDQIVIACKPNTYQQKVEEKRIQVYAVLNFISAMFLLLTDIVYILIWRHQNNIHSWLQFSYATSLLLTFTCFFIVQTWSEQLLSISPKLCIMMGWLTHLTYLSAFFWLTSMNFDLWWRFSRPLRSTRIQTQEKNRKRFLGFAVFSIALPLMISCIGIILDYKYGGQLLDPPVTVPGFGKEKCYFESKHAQIPYLYFPAGVLLLMDFIFFASTVLHLRKMHTHTELARTQSTSTIEDKKGVRIIAKLFVVMGVLWIFELLSWICRLIFTQPDHEMILLIIFTPVDCLNSIQGVFIFFIFICKPNVRNQLAALFRKEDITKTWNKQTPLPSETTVQQPVSAKQNHYVEIK